jgi:hypothetical protein
MNRIGLSVVSLFLFGFSLTAVLQLGAARAAQSDATAAQSQAKVRIGVYDSRAVAVAYARSKFNPLQAKMAEHAAAKSAGDEKKVKELEAWGQQQQRMLHFQGFCRVPVTDLLEHVKPGLDKLIADQHLAAIAMACDATSSGVEIVDITDQIVDLYEPSEQARQTIRQLKDVAPTSLLEVAKMSDKD